MWLILWFISPKAPDKVCSYNYGCSSGICCPRALSINHPTSWASHTGSQEFSMWKGLETVYKTAYGIEYKRSYYFYNI